VLKKLLPIKHAPAITAQPSKERRLMPAGAFEEAAEHIILRLFPFHLL
jgi:hypothetical protein